ncbi:inner membrane protein YpjD [Paenibacillus sp. J2TS4]|uniref:cytochrome C assembly family protein n=1 Tax=Paenibacillus sp. J2TS4 TaxID=2807194 RepID=UPI001B1A6748|nr:cytochrome c biogenesis protein CcsA [Paenibacillus sp. J2TS4]GIP31344.1 protein HemX [Paenibacillus sp. J2TS4]
MVTQSWIYDAIIYIYALSLLFYFSDFVGANRSAKRMGTGLLIFVWVLQTIYFFFEFKTVHVFTNFETLFFFSWVLVTVSLVINRFFSIELLVFFVNLVGFAILALNFFSDNTVSTALKGWQIADELLFIHVSLAIGSYAAFTISAILSVMYLFLHGQLKDKKWSRTMRRIPSLEKIEKYTYVAVVAGIPLLMLALSLGIVWIVLQGEVRLLLDPKVLNSLFILALYAYHLLLKLSLKASGYRLAQWNLFSFFLVLVNFFILNRFSIFHSWFLM